MDCCDGSVLGDGKLRRAVVKVADKARLITRVQVKLAGPSRSLRARKVARRRTGNGLLGVCKGKP